MVLQSFVYAFVSASLIVLVGMGFQIIFRVGRFFHFAHGGIFAVAPYLMFLFGIWIQFPLWLALFLSLSICVLLGLAMEFFCYYPIRKISNPANTLLLCSLGIFIILQSLLALGFGNETRSLRRTPVVEGWLMMGIRLTTIQVLIIVCAAICLISLWTFIRFTRVGKQMEAVASDPDLARAVGIDIEGIYLWTIGLGSALAAIAGILTSYDVDMSPTMGMQPLMMGVVATIIGGNTLLGMAGGALLLGMTQHLNVIWLSSKWQDAIIFAILILFLLFRPQGFLGKPLRKTAA